MDINQVIEFVSNHSLLAFGVVAVIALIVGNEIVLRTRGYRDITAENTVPLMNTANAILIDIRDNGDFRGSHIVGAKNIPQPRMQERAIEVLPDKEQAVVTYCATGQKSSKAAADLVKLGYKNVYNLRGGLTAWREAHLPTEGKRK